MRTAESRPEQDFARPARGVEHTAERVPAALTQGRLQRQMRVSSALFRGRKQEESQRAIIENIGAQNGERLIGVRMGHAFAKRDGLLLFRHQRALGLLK
ncbi:hypothetical protein J2Y48_004453 [Mycoplana sp. BE70]|uniref:hypothetical protein n=1 Tax=Mycoplana sp. BE70 TaxID=2817775 RepID=UPI002860193B|nr:hypothetical protein [Mycoplana sp. BE70]MDR6759137.1 hypothetical protein [Mycoplana sp. BE70]